MAESTIGATKLTKLEYEEEQVEASDHVIPVQKLATMEETKDFAKNLNFVTDDSIQPVSWKATLDHLLTVQI